MPVFPPHYPEDWPAALGLTRTQFAEAGAPQRPGRSASAGHRSAVGQQSVTRQSPLVSRLDQGDTKGRTMRNLGLLLMSLGLAIGEWERGRTETQIACV